MRRRIVLGLCAALGLLAARQEPSRVGQNPETQNPETQNPETQNPETQNPEAQNPEAQNPETQNPGTQNPESGAPAPTVTFAAFDVFVDVGTQRLAAWQLELTEAASVLVGVEGGGVPAFADAPRYDPAALQGQRVILAALADGAALPTGRVRVARVHFAAEQGQIGEVALRGLVAVDADGNEIEARPGVARIAASQGQPDRMEKK